MAPNGYKLIPKLHNGHNSLRAYKKDLQTVLKIRDHQEKQIQSEAQIDGLTSFDKILEVCNHQQIHLWLPLHTLKLGETHMLE
ncbi:hypothetical protein GQ457_11G030750 [Hibiscus cannabinus]